MKKLLIIGLLTISLFGFLGTGKASAYSTAGLCMKYPYPHGTYYSQAYAKDSYREHAAVLYGIDAQGSRYWKYFSGYFYDPGQTAYSPIHIVWNPTAHIGYR